MYESSQSVFVLLGIPATFAGHWRCSGRERTKDRRGRLMGGGDNELCGRKRRRQEAEKKWSSARGDLVAGLPLVVTFFGFLYGSNINVECSNINCLRLEISQRRSRFLGHRSSPTSSGEEEREQKTHQYKTLTLVLRACCC